MRYLVAALSLFAFSQVAMAVDIPEANKSNCQNPDVMTKLATEMQSVTDTKTLQDYSQFIQKCHNIIAGKQFCSLMQVI